MRSTGKGEVRGRLVCFRIMEQARLLYYILRCYVFLCACGNGNLLLQCAIQESLTLDTPETSAVLNALQIFSDKNKL